MSFKGILFDLGSTLIEFDNTEWDKLERACVQQGYEFLVKRGYKIPDWEDGVKEVLEHFKKQNFKIGLISNSSFPTEFHIEELKNYEIINFFEETLFSYDFGLRKPHPDLFKNVLIKLKLKPQETVFIADRLIEDVSGPQKVGMKAILKYKKERDYSAPVVPDYVVNNLSELPEVIRKFK